MSVLITGGSGILGSELKKKFPNALTPTHEELDISDRSSVNDFFNKNEFDIIIHTAAMTSVRKCEEEKDHTWKINVEGTKNLVLATKKLEKQIKFVFVSTACVFDGHSEMYNEKSIPNPENFYALTKLLGEQYVSTLKNSIMIRTNFVARKKWPYEKAFTDRFGTYLFADQVAQGIQDILEEQLEGIIHIVGDKKISMFELAKKTTPEIKPMNMSEYSGPKLTIDMSLDTERWKKYNID